MSEYQR